MTSERRRFRFSLRSLILFVAVCGSGYGLWYNRAPWELVRSERIEDMYAPRAHNTPGGGVRLLGIVSTGKWPDSALQIIDLLSGRVESEIPIYGAYEFNVAPDGTRIVTYANTPKLPDTPIRLWDGDGRKIAELAKDRSAQMYRGTEQILSPGGRWIGDNGGTKYHGQIWRTLDGAPLRHVKGFLGFLTDELLLAESNKDKGAFEIQEIESGQVRHVILAEQWIENAAPLSWGVVLTVREKAPASILYSVTSFHTGKNLGNAVSVSKEEDEFYSWEALLSPDFRRLATVPDTKTIEILDLTKGASRKTLRVKFKDINLYWWSSDSRYLITNEYDAEEMAQTYWSRKDLTIVRIWDVDQGICIWKSGDEQIVDFDPVRGRLMTYWDPYGEVAEFGPHVIEVSPDRSLDKFETRLRDVRTGQLLWRVRGHGDTFLSDGNRMTIEDKKGNLLLFERRRDEMTGGFFAQPVMYMTIALALTLLWSLHRDWKGLSQAGQPPGATP